MDNRLKNYMHAMMYTLYSGTDFNDVDSTTELSKWSDFNDVDSTTELSKWSDTINNAAGIQSVHSLCKLELSRAHTRPVR